MKTINEQRAEIGDKMYRLKEYILDNFETEIAKSGMISSPESFKNKDTYEEDFERFTEDLNVSGLVGHIN